MLPPPGLGPMVDMITFDDLVAAFGDELHRLGEAGRRQVCREGRRGQAQHVRKEVVGRLQEAATSLRQIGGEAMAALRRGAEALREKLRRRRD